MRYNEFSRRTWPASDFPKFEQGESNGQVGTEDTGLITFKTEKDHAKLAMIMGSQ
jgi:hypothetical protein